MRNKTFFILLSAVLVLALCSPMFAQTTNSRVSVADYGAKGDGVTDDTAAFEKAMAAVAEKGGNVFVPSGNYMIKSHLVIPSMVTLEGIWSIPTAFTQMKGSTLLAVEGAGSEEGTAFITLSPNSTLKGMTVYYPDQKPEKIVPYPWCVACAGGDNASIIDCLLVNPYQGVDFGSNASGRHYIRNLYGQPLRRGIFVDKCFDVGRIENVHFWPFWKWDAESGIQKWLTDNGEAFIFARTDWEYVYNTFVFGYGVGYKFIQSKDGAMNGNLLGIGADATNIAVLVEACQPAGLLITNGEFVSFFGDNPTEVIVKDTNSGVVQFQNSAFWGPSDQIARIAGTGTVSFNNCNFVQWDRNNKSLPAIESYGGHLLINGCSFHSESPQLSLRDKARSAIVMGNRMGGPLRISNKSKANLQVGLNVFSEPLKRPAEEKGAIVIDDVDADPSVKLIGEWHLAAGEGYYYRSTRWASKGDGNAQVICKPKVPKTGYYAVYAYFGPDPMSDHAANAPVTVNTKDKTITKHIDLRNKKGEWANLGTYRFTAGSDGSVVFSNNADGNVLFDAVKLVPSPGRH